MKIDSKTSTALCHTLYEMERAGTIFMISNASYHDRDLGLDRRGLVVIISLHDEFRDVEKLSDCITAAIMSAGVAPTIH